jgi:penicillin amidase
MTKNSPAAAIEVLARHQLFDMILEPKLGPLVEDYDWANSTIALENILTREPKGWLPTGFANYDELLLAALEATVKGQPGLKSLRLGALRPLSLSHPIFGRIPFLQRWAGPGNVQQSGGPWTIKMADDQLGPSERMTVDLAHLDDSKLNIVNGESGELFSPYFNNQWKAWYEGTSFILPFSDPAVEKSAVHRLTLVPSRISH